MVHIHGDYYIKPDEQGFVLVEDKHKEDKKGNKVYSTIAYCGTMAHALKVAYRVIAGEKLSEKERELAEAIEVLKDVKDMFEYKLRGL